VLGILEFGTWNFGIWYLEFGTWNFGIWYLEFGTWNFRIWYLEFGTWNLVLGIWYLEFGTWNLPKKKGISKTGNALRIFFQIDYFDLITNVLAIIS